MEMQRSSTEHVAISSTKWLAQGHTLQKEKRKSSSFNALHQEERIGQQCLKAIRHGRFSSEDCWWQSKLPHLREVQKVGTIPARANPRGCLPASVFVGMASRMELRMADKHHALVRFFFLFIPKYITIRYNSHAHFRVCNQRIHNSLHNSLPYKMTAT